MSITFLHTADWQIGKQFANFPEEAAVKLRTQRIDSIKTIAALATKHDVDCVLVAGDVFDFDGVSEKTVRQTLNAMTGFKGQWILISGNHDAATSESVWKRLRKLNPPSNVVILDEPQAYTLERKHATILAAPLQRRHDATDVTEWFDTHQTPADHFRIGLAHGSVDNRIPDRGDNAPNTINDRRAEKAKLDYLALGDWHGTHTVNAKTWYSGTHETDRFKSNDPGNVLLVSLAAPGAPPAVQSIPVGHFRWKQLEPIVDAAHAAADIEKAINDLGEPFDNLVLELTPRGAVGLNARYAIETELRKWEALVHYLKFDDSRLSGEASQEELENIGKTAFVGVAVDKLQAIAKDETNPEQEIANLALQLLFMEQQELAGVN